MIAGQREGVRGAVAGSVDTAPARARQVRRAWAFLSAAFSVFLLLCFGLAGAGYWYRGHATTERLARVEVVGGGERAFIRPAYQVNWSALPVAPRGTDGEADPASRPAPAPIFLREGDALKTEEGTRVFLTLWDESKVEVFERTQIEITEMRTTQYINRVRAFSLHQKRGLVRVSPAAGDYGRSRFQITADPDPQTGRDRTTVLLRDSGQSAAGGSFLVEVTTGADGETTSAVRASVRRGVGAVRVQGYEDEVRLEANQQTIVPAGGAPGPLTAARRDLVVNGRFEPQEGIAQETLFPPWRKVITPGQSGPSGQLKPVADSIGGRPVSALEIARSLDSTDSANTGLRQNIDALVADSPSLVLTAQVKVLAQSLPGGGEAGTEFPIIVRVTYRDQQGRAHDFVRGFYSVPDPSRPGPERGRAVPADTWVPVELDLRDLTPQPVRIDAIEVYASGHGYRARITDVAIVSPD